MKSDANIQYDTIGLQIDGFPGAFWKRNPQHFTIKHQSRSEKITAILSLRTAIIEIIFYIKYKIFAVPRLSIDSCNGSGRRFFHFLLDAQSVNRLVRFAVIEEYASFLMRHTATPVPSQ